MNELITGRRFPSKILLFGEYSVILGGKALAIPYEKYGGEWKSSNRSFRESLDRDFIHYLCTHGRLKELLNSDLLQQILYKNIVFQSNIPHGYGMGSSGALSAAIYDALARQKSKNPERLRKELSWVETYFHGSSSGIDPLVSYLNRAILVRDKSVKIQTSWNLEQDPYHIFLLDSGKRRSTSGFVEKFMNRCSVKQFRDQIESEMNAAFAKCIDLVTQNFDPDALFNSWMRLSEFQFLNFRTMIPKSIQPIWKKGLDSGLYALKLCGAGGGGIFLGIRKRIILPNP